MKKNIFGKCRQINGTFLRNLFKLYFTIHLVVPTARKDADGQPDYSHTIPITDHLNEREGKGVSTISPEITYQFFYNYSYKQVGM